MASLQYIQNRIDGKTKEIAKLEKKLERIRKAEATNWTVNPYYYHESDLKWTIRDLDNARKALDKYTKDLAVEQEKANSRNVPAIVEFLNGWKIRVRCFYIESFDRYQDAKKEHYEESHKLSEAIINSRTPEARKLARKDYDAERKAFNEKWSFIFPYEDRKLNEEKTHYVPFLNLEKLDKELEQEANRKYDFIIERTNAIVGTITDANGLYVGAKGDLNGLIKGTNGIARVNTIGAGGYNIQCYHFRTLIHAA